MMPEIEIIAATKTLQQEPISTAPKKLRVAAYARVSTEQDEQQNSYEAQIDFYTRHIKTNPDWQFVGVFADRGITGTNTKNRDEFNKMIEGIGLDGSGTLTDHFLEVLTSDHYQYTGLSYVEQGGKIIYKGGAYEEPSTYQPLVREGVVWHYVYWNYEVMWPYCTELNVQFKGDTTICGVQYKKCFLFDSPTLPDNALPVYYAREENGKVMFTQPRHQVVDTLHGAFMPEIPGEFFELNGETLVYDFSDMSSFAENIHAEIVSTSEVEVNGVPAKKYHLSLPDAYECDFVEGVGVDGINCGVLFRPFIVLSTGYYSRPCGFNKLTDLDGNVLYKGAQFDDTFNSVDAVHDNKKTLLVAQNSTSLHIALPADGMLSVIDMAGHVVISRVATQGTTEVSTASLAAGVYVVQLSTTTGIHTAKVVVK